MTKFVVDNIFEISAEDLSKVLEKMQDIHDFVEMHDGYGNLVGKIELDELTDGYAVSSFDYETGEYQFENVCLFPEEILDEVNYW